MSYKKIVFIVPYYGSFPSYFREWAFSAGFLFNSDIDYFLVTDIPVDFQLPSNIKVLPMTFESLRNKIQEKFDFPIGLTTPYKLCDFKPTLGYVFENEIQGYDFWGNCDLDQVWGDVRKFITDDILDAYDRVQFLGHFILYRNTYEINRAFMMPGSIYDYRKVLSDTMHYSFCEHSGMMKIVVSNKISNYLSINYADLSPRYKRMIISRQNNYDYQLLFWQDGQVYRAYIDDSGNVKIDEYMYFHFQRKHPKSLSCWEEGRIPERIIYNANAFIEGFQDVITPDYIKKYCDFESRQIDKQESNDYTRKKMSDFLRSSWKKKRLWLKQRIATKEVINHEEYFGKNYSNSNR